MLKRIFTLFAAGFAPWLVLLLNDNPGGALIALVMQASIIGWIPASMWAWRVMRESQKEKEALKKERKVKKAQAKESSSS